MKNGIFVFEIRYWLRAPVTYILTGAMFLFALATMLGTGGYFDGTVTATTNPKYLNSPYSISYFSFLLTKLQLFGVAFFATQSLYRDYQSNTHTILYTYPLSKTTYLLGKLGSALTFILAGGLLCLFGLFLGEILLGSENPLIGSTDLNAYLIAFCLYMAPNLLISGFLVFIIVGLSRNILSGFITVLAIVLTQLILENILFEKPALLALFDPFGQHAFFYATQNWDLAQQNASALPLHSLVMWNRIIWGSLVLLAYTAFTRAFDFQYRPILNRKKKQAKTNRQARDIQEFQPVNIQQNFSSIARFKACLQLMIYDLRSILRNWLFIAITTFGLLAVFFIQFRISHSGDLVYYPVPRLLLGAPLSIYVLLLMFCSFLFTGALVGNTRRNKMNLLVDATAVKNWQLVTSKIGAISLLHFNSADPLSFLLCPHPGIQPIPYIRSWAYFFSCLHARLARSIDLERSFLFCSYAFHESIFRPACFTGHLDQWSGT